MSTDAPAVTGTPEAARDRSLGTGTGWLPAAFVFAAGALVLLLRRPLPLDEVRYLQVLEESRGHLGFLTLMERPYADKTPLLLWLAALLSWLGIGLEASLRLMPALCSAGTVLCAQALGRRLGLGGGGWFQAAMLLPFLGTQYLLFDPLLVVSVWACLVAWSGGRDRWAALGAAFAFLAKGPVAALFLIPFGWALAPLRPPGPWKGALARTVLLGLVPLVAWAVYVGIVGGPDFRRELWWDRWAGRVQESFAHDRPFHYYVPIFVLGALPLTPLLFAGVREVVRSRASRASGRPRPLVRTALACAAIFVLLSLISGKQPHYLLPLAPALAVGGAAALRRASGQLWLRVGILAHLGVLSVALGWKLVGSAGALARYGDYGTALMDDAVWRVLPPAGLAVCLAAMLAVLVLRPGPRASVITVFVLTGAAFVPIHLAADRLILPDKIEAALQAEDRSTPIGLVGNRYAGLFHRLSGRSDLQKLNEKSLARFMRENPGGIVVGTGGTLDELHRMDLRVEVQDLVRGDPVEILRVPAEPR